MNDLPLLAVTAIVGYLLGAIPTGQLLAGMAGIDLSTRGSGKTGMTNVLRTLGPGAAAVVLVGDLGKGVVAVLLARSLFAGHDAQHWAEVLAGFGAVLGHNWSVYIRFKGGRGVLVSLAVFISICWPAALISVAISLVVLALSRMVSLASLVGAAAGLPILAAFVVLAHYPFPYLIYGIAAAALVWLRHIDNIQRLLAGTERKLGQRA